MIKLKLDHELYEHELLHELVHFFVLTIIYNIYYIWIISIFLCKKDNLYIYHIHFLKLKCQTKSF